MLCDPMENPVWKSWMLLDKWTVTVEMVLISVGMLKDGRLEVFLFMYMVIETKDTSAFWQLEYNHYIIMVLSWKKDKKSI